MDKRKAIVIAVVLFLLIGLGTFVFTNPSEERLDGNDTGITDNGNNNDVDGENTDGEEETEQPEEETEEDEVISVIDDGSNDTGDGNFGNGNGGSSNNNNENNNNNNNDETPEEDNSAYLAALAALEKAEASYLQGDLDSATSLISELTDGNDKQGLVDRANALQNVIDVETLVKNLQNQVNVAENIDNVNSARDYRANEDIINKVNNLADSSKKEELKGILSEVAVILDDTTAPGISGIDNGVVTALDVALTVDETNVTVLVNGEEKTLDEIKNITEHGTYKVTVTDQAYNATTIEFTIDKKLPEFNVESGTHSDTAMEIVVTDDTFDYMNVINQDTGVTEKYTTNTITLEEEATYHIYAFDKAGNYKELWIAIDKTDPTINVAGTNVDGYFRDEEVTLTVFDKFLTEVTVNGETFDKDDFTYANNNENATLTKTYTVEGKYEVVAKDKFGHEKTYTFVIDKTAPKRTSANILEYNADNNLGTYYVTKGDIIHAYVSFDEPLAENPSFVFINDGKEYAPTKVDQLLPDEKTGKYIYNAYYEVNETDMIDGEVTFKVTNIKDTAGNTTEVSEVTNGHRVFVDRSPIQKSHFYFIGTHEENRNVVGDGQYIIVEAAFDEEFTSVPRLKIGEGQYIDLDDCHWTTDWSANKFVCRNSSVRLDNSLAKLGNDQVIPVEITNIVDKAGNETVLTNNDVTFNDTYKELVFDSKCLV